MYGYARNIKYICQVSILKLDSLDNYVNLN